MHQTLLLAIALLALIPVSAQVCQPDTTITGTQGIFPNQNDGIPAARVSELYEHVSTVKVPTDTIANVFGSPQQVYIDSIVVDTILGVPAWATYACEPSTCGFAGGGSGCVTFTGTPLQGEGGRTYAISFITITYARLAIFPTQQFQQVDTVQDYYQLYVEFGVEVEERNIEIALFPNPVAETLTLLLPDVGVHYQAMDMQGRTMVKTIGYGPQQIYVRHWPVGIYLFRVWDGTRTTELKVVVQR